MDTVLYTRKAVKQLRKIPKHYADKFRLAFEKISMRDETGLDIKSLKGRDGFRLRFGDYRALYQLNDKEVNVLVLDVGSRGSIYK